MSCCARCEQTGASCHDQGLLGWLGMGEPYSTGNYVVAGSVIAWGGYIRDAAGASRWSDIVEGQIKTALWNSGGFSWVDAGQISGFVNQYVSIKVTTKVDFSHLGDVLDLINGVIYQTGFRPDVQNFWVESVPASAANRTDIATPGTGGGANTGNQPSITFPTISLPNLSDIFGGSTGPSNNGNPIDRLATWLGVGQTEAVVIGVGVGIVGVLALKGFVNRLL